MRISRVTDTAPPVVVEWYIAIFQIVSSYSIVVDAVGSLIHSSEGTAIVGTSSLW